MKTLTLCVVLWVVAATAIVLPPQKNAPKFFIGAGTGAVTNPYAVLHWIDMQTNVAEYEVWQSLDMVHWQIYGIATTNSFVIPLTNRVPWTYFWNQYLTNDDGSLTLTNTVPLSATNSYGFYIVRPRDIFYQFQNSADGIPTGPWATTASNALPLQ